MMLWYWGEEYVPTDKFKYGIATDSLAQSIGLRDGDRIKSVDGEYVERFNKIPLKVILSGAKTLQVDRGGQPVNINIPSDFGSKLIRYKTINFIDMRVPFVKLDEVVDTAIAYRSGLRAGDKIISVNGQPITYYHEFIRMMQRNKNKDVRVNFLRDGTTYTVRIRVPGTGVIGVRNVPVKSLFEIKEINYNFFSAIPAGFNRSIETLTSYWLQLKLIFSGKVNTNESLGSVISIGKMFPGKWDWQNFWALTAFFSLVLALMNILPIPALDGGHALFTIIEMITGRKPNEKVIEYAQMAGMILLLGLMAYALGLDIFRLFK